jgi:hypothetical protein
MLRHSLVYTGITRGKTAGGFGGAAQSVDDGSQGLASCAPMVKTESMATRPRSARGVNNAPLCGYH